MARHFATISLLPLLPLLPLLASAGFLPYDPRDTLDFSATSQRRNVNNSIPILGFEERGSVGISAQMMFLGTNKKVYILDKTENNPTTITGQFGTHPAWAVEYDFNNNTFRPMDVLTNTFCAGGGVLGNGTWAVFGGNQPITTGGIATDSAGAYDDKDGGTAIRMINPCDDESCEWIQGATTYDINDDTGGWLQMTSRRWYPTVEVLPDGTMIIISGDLNGGYVNTAAQNNPTYEFFPPQGGAVTLDWLTDCLPINLYPITFLMPSGLLFMQANRSTIMYNYTSQAVTNLPDMPHAARVYPASAATALLPLTPDNNYTATVLFCGGSATEQWGNDGSPGYNVTAVPADNTCVRITPDDSNPQYEDDDFMLEGRSMGEFVFLPDGSMWMGNGVGMGTAGYGNDDYSIGQSYGQDPVYMPAIYNWSAPAGARWNRTGLQASTNERMYHSTAILLPDSSVLVCGSNPNADFENVQWRSRTDCDRWYPWYYQEARPTYDGIPNSISYGGDGFNLTLNVTDQASIESLKVVLIRGGFHTHAMGFGQRYLQLENSYMIDLNTNTTTIHVSQLPGNPGPTLFQPGPTLFFVVMNGIPSEGDFVMVGNGQLGDQPTAPNTPLPSSQVKTVQESSSSGSSGGSSGGSKSSASVLSHVPSVLVGALSVLVGSIWILS